MKNFIKKIILLLSDLFINFRNKENIKKFINNNKLIIGSHTYGVNNLDIHFYKGSESSIIIGKYCSLSRDITIITGGIHPINWISTYPFRINWDMNDKYEDGMPFSNGDIIIGNDVWIGTGVTILSGVKIGNGAVIAAGSMVTKDVLPYAIVGGNPVRVIRFRFNKSQIDRLLKIKWWNWNDVKVKEYVSLINSNSIEDFLDSINND